MQPFALGNATVPQIKLGEAARLAGRSKSTIHRALEAGRIAYTVDSDGERLIDVAELARAFALKPPGEPDEIAERNPDGTGRHSAQPPDRGQLVADLAAERARAAGLEARLADMQETVADLRQRLDQEGEERRAAVAKLTALLTDQRPPRRRWWQQRKAAE